MNFVLHADGAPPLRAPGRATAGPARLTVAALRAALLGVLALAGLGSSEVAAEYWLQPTEAPAGWTDLCRRETTLCRHFNRALDRPALTAESRAELERVNREVNHSLTYKTDQAFLGREEFWSFPIDGTGDCEDFALEKRRRLMALGWPRAALLMTVVVAYNGEWHALLTVDTADGPLVLDNMTDAVLPPEKTGHRFHSSQSRLHPNQWVRWSAREFVSRPPAPADPAAPPAGASGRGTP